MDILTELSNLLMEDISDLQNKSPQYRELTRMESRLLGQHRTMSPAAADGKFGPQMRYFFLKYIKYSCEKVPFCGSKFSRHPLLSNCAVLP